MSVNNLKKKREVCITDLEQITSNDNFFVLLIFFLFFIRLLYILAANHTFHSIKAVILIGALI